MVQLCMMTRELIQIHPGWWACIERPTVKKGQRITFEVHGQVVSAGTVTQVHDMTGKPGKDWGFKNPELSWYKLFYKPDSELKGKTDGRSSMPKMRKVIRYAPR